MDVNLARRLDPLADALAGAVAGLVPEGAG